MQKITPEDGQSANIINENIAQIKALFPDACTENGVDFDTLRQFGGMSGFLARSESEHDVFGAGHAGTSISAAHGVAVARDLRGEEYNVVAIIGDGALTAGLAFEGLNNVGHDHRRVLTLHRVDHLIDDPSVGAEADLHRRR